MRTCHVGCRHPSIEKSAADPRCPPAATFEAASGARPRMPPDPHNGQEGPNPSVHFAKDSFIQWMEDILHKFIGPFIHKVSTIQGGAGFIPSTFSLRSYAQFNSTMSFKGSAAHLARLPPCLVPPLRPPLEPHRASKVASARYSSRWAINRLWNLVSGFNMF